MPYKGLVQKKSAARDFGAVKFGVISDPHLDIKGMKMSAKSVNCVRKTFQGLNMEEDL